MARFYDENIKIDLSKYTKKCYINCKYLIGLLEKCDEADDYGSYNNYLNTLEADLKNLVEIGKMDMKMFNLIMRKYGGGH